MAGHTYHIAEIPDPYSPRHQIPAGGSVAAALSRATQELLRVVADSGPEASIAILRYAFSPMPTDGAQQRRLSISLTVKGPSPAKTRGLDVLVRRGPLGMFFDFEEEREDEPAWAELSAVCHVVRRETLLPPLHSPEVNPAIPDMYYLVTPFSARESVDFATLDRVLDALNEPVIMEIAVSSVDARDELRSFTAYLDRLQSINRPRRSDWDDEPGPPRKIGTAREDVFSRQTVRPPSPRKDPTADDVFRALRRHAESLADRNLSFNIRVAASNAEAAELVASVYAEATLEDGAFSLLTADGRGDVAVKTIRGMQEGLVVDVPTLEELLPGDVSDIYRGFGRLSNLATIEELKGAFCLPVAGYSSPRTIRRDTDPKHVEQSKLIVLGYDYESRVARGRGKPGDLAGIPRGIDIDNLVKHVFVAGIPGMGKTTAMLNIICQLWRAGIPALVLEAVKTEYRALVQLSNSKDPKLRELAEQVRCFTPGNEHISPYRHNPFIVPEGALPDQRLQGVLRCLKAGMALQGPLFPILIESTYRLFEDFEGTDAAPTMDDLALAAEKVLRNKGYAQEVESTLLGALRVRFAGLTMGAPGRIFRCTQNVPNIPDLFEYPHIVEFDALEPEQAALETMALLRDVRDHVKDKPFKKGPPRLVIIVEEAHLLAGRTRGPANMSELDPDPSAFASDYIVRMLAECRALGIALVICDQLPSAVAAEVVKNTGSTICLKQKDMEEREVMSSAMLLGSMESEELARFVPGDAFLMTEGYEVPRRIRLQNTKDELGLDDPPLGQRLLAHIENNAWYTTCRDRRLTGEMDLLAPRHEAAMSAITKSNDEYEQLSKALEKLTQMQMSALDQRSREELRRVVARARQLRAEIAELCGDHARFYRSLMNWQVPANTAPAVIEKRNKFEHEFKDLTERARRFDESIDGFIEACRKLFTATGKNRSK